MIYAIAACTIFYNYMIASDALLFLVCLLMMAVASSAVYISHLLYKSHRDIVDYVSAASALIIVIMMYFSGYITHAIICMIIFTFPMCLPQGCFAVD